jgi:hypothetical protein
LYYTHLPSVDAIEKNASHLIGKCMVLQRDTILVESSRFGRNGFDIVKTDDHYALVRPEIIVTRLNRGLKFEVIDALISYKPAASPWDS